jgi:dolichol-phosphate mannosyltransferase
VPKIYLIIPTYNEKGNIASLLAEIFDLNLPDFWVLVVDDNSPDGTGQLAESLKSKYPNLDVMHRNQKSGLGRAYVASFTEVLKRGADYIIHMDADRSHAPSYLPDFLAAIKEADLVLGSRYIPGGGVKNWSKVRQLISRFGNAYARAVLGLPFKDLTGGYKCFRRAVLEKISLADVSSVGYSFIVEMTYKTYQAGFKIKEIPIIFVERALGKSKFDVKIILESFYRILALRFKK